MKHLNTLQVQAPPLPNQTAWGKSDKAMRVVLLALTLIIAALAFLPSFAHAADTDSAAAQQQLRQYVLQSVQSETYETSGGGQVNGADLFQVDDKTNALTVDRTQFKKLTGESQSQFMRDMADAAQDASADGSVAHKSQTPLVTDETVHDWLSQLQETTGTGTNLLMLASTMTKADLATGVWVLKPIAPILNALAGILIMFTFPTLFLRFGVDVALITFSTAGKIKELQSKATIGGFTLISSTAVHARESAENKNKGTATALLFYLLGSMGELIAITIVTTVLSLGQGMRLVSIISDTSTNWLPSFN